MRLSEAYLTRAEAKFRLGEDATEDINTLRRRANCTRLVQTVTEKEIIDEWAREFYLEGRRRSLAINIYGTGKVEQQPELLFLLSTMFILSRHRI